MNQPNNFTSASDSSFSDSVAKLYQSTLVPLIFEPYAEDLALRAKALNPDAVLEIACGTGVVTRALATALPLACEITATDLNNAMVSHAESMGTTRPVTWRQANVTNLPYDDASFDVIVCQFSVMFFDRVAAYRELRRVLRPGGTFLFNVWNDIERNEFAKVVTDAVRELYPDDPPQFLTRTPYGQGCPDDIKADVKAAGFVECRLTRLDEVSRARTPDVPSIAYCQGTPLRDEIEARDPGGLERATTASTEAIRARYGDGPVEAPISAFVVSTTSPRS